MCLHACKGCCYTLERLHYKCFLWIQAGKYIWTCFRSVVLSMSLHFCMAIVHTNLIFHNFCLVKKYIALNSILRWEGILLPENPSGHLHSYSFKDFKMHFPLFRHGDELHAVSSDISQRLAENPTGHLHWKLTCPSLIKTSQVPPFWHLGAVRQGLAYSQNSPTYRDVQLKMRKYYDSFPHVQQCKRFHNLHQMLRAIINRCE